MGLRPFLLLVFHLFVVLADDVDRSNKRTRNVEITAEEEKVRDAKGFAAIKEIHREMDDDASGTIDRSESGGFMAEDMNMRSSERVRREKAFHGEDDAISVDDLWEAWFESPERAWNTQQLIYWLTTVVNLPQYAETFESLGLDGQVLPRLAVHNSSFFMATQLNVKSSVHRQKLRLSALDVVLFGYRETTNRVKDIALALLLLVLSAVVGILVRQRRRSKQELLDLSAKLAQLHSMQNALEDVQPDLRSRRPTHEVHEIEALRNQLDEAHRRLEMNNYTGGTAPLALQPLLRRTCEMELNLLTKQRAECVVEMKEAIDEVDRLRRKQTSLINSLKIATGASTGSDQIDAKIFGLKSRMETIQTTSRDAQERWMQIESLCGFSIFSTFTEPEMRKKPPPPSGSAPQFYRCGDSGGSSSSLDSERPSSMLSSPSGAIPDSTAPSLLSSSTAPQERGSEMSSTSSDGTRRRKRDVLKSLFRKSSKAPSALSQTKSF